MANLKNINFMSKTRFDSVTTSDEELYLVDYGDIDFVVESLEDGTKWCKVYKSGWCEQGQSNVTTNTTITFLKPFVDTNYTLTAVTTSLASISATNQAYVQCGAKTTTNFAIRARHNTISYAETCDWRACGYIK